VVGVTRDTGKDGKDEGNKDINPRQDGQGGPSGMRSKPRANCANNGDFTSGQSEGLSVYSLGYLYTRDMVCAYLLIVGNNSKVAPSINTLQWH
jgi:hypothetical protein